MATNDYSGFLKDKVIHERSRLLILSYLIGSETGKASFMELQKPLIFRGGICLFRLKNCRRQESTTFDSG